MRKILSLAVLCVITLISAGLSGCKPGERVHSATEKHYELKGKVVSVDKSSREVTVAHEDIKDYMAAMTMPFKIKDDWVLEIASPGKQISATLIVDGTESWLEDVVLTEGADLTTIEGVGPKMGEEVPNYRLTNQDGKVIRLHDYKGKALLLTFIYTRCQDPNQCTLMSSNFATIDKELQKQPELYAKTHLLSVSFDSAYDTPKVLRSYGAAYTGRYSEETFSHWEFASGSPDEVKGITKFFGFSYYMDTSGNEQVVHSLRTAIIDPDGKVLSVYRGNEWKTDQAILDLNKVLQEAEVRKLGPIDHGPVPPEPKIKKN